MFKVNKIKENSNFFKYKQKNEIVNWKAIPEELRRELREYLIGEQEENCCPYCESKISLKKSHIEHIKPKDRFPKLLLETENFIASCNNKNRCGNFKGNKWDENFINPVLENPEEYLDYDIKTGEIKPIYQEKWKVDKAKTTIDLLNLNEVNLCDIRKRRIVESLNNLEIVDYIEGFPSLKRYLKNILV